MPASDESTTSNPSLKDHEWISYEEAAALVRLALPEFKDDGQAARGALVRALEEGKVRCRDLDGQELRPNDVRDSPLSRVNAFPYIFRGGINATRWRGVRNTFVAVGSVSVAPVKKRVAKGITDFWPHVLGRCAARLVRYGMPAEQKDLEKMLTSLIEEADRTAEESTIRRYAVGLRDGWRSETVD
jgi:hypothetical protein